MVYMLLGTGFEETEAIAPLDLLRRAGVDIQTVGINGKIVYGSHGIGIEADIELGQMDLTSMEMIILPGGLGGVASIRDCQKALEAVRTVYDMGGYVAAICAGPTVLADLGLLTDVKATCYPGQIPNMADARVVEGAACVTDGKIITGRSSSLMVAAASSVLNSIKYLAGYPDPLLLITEQVLEASQKMKTEILRSDRKALNVEEVMIALSISSTQNPAAEVASSKLELLRGCKAHCTAILSDHDEQTLQAMGLDVTCDPEYVTTNLYTN
jgi:DJ-1 family protein